MGDDLPRPKVNRSGQGTFLISRLIAQNSQAAAFSVLIFRGGVLTLRTAAPIEALPAYAFFASAQFVAVPVDGEPAPDQVRL